MNELVIAAGKIIKKEFKTEDRIISMIDFPDPTPVRVTITDKHLNVFIGPRDIQFDLETGECVGGGVGLCGTDFKKGDGESKPQQESCGN